MNEEFDLNLKPPPKSIAELLSKSSLEVKRERKTETVDIKEIDELLFQLDHVIDYKTAYSQIGLSPRIYRDHKQKGFAPKTTKYALLGLLFEQNKEKNHEFSYDELAIILGSLINHIKDRAEPYKQEIADIQKIIMKLMLEKMEK